MCANDPAATQALVVRTIAVFFSVAAVSAGLQPENRWHADLFTSERLVADGNYGTATNLLKRLVAESVSLPANDPRRGIVLNDLGVVHQHLGEYQEAKRLMLQSVEQLESSTGHHDLLRARSLTNLTALYLDMREYSKAQAVAQRALALIPVDSQPVQRAHILNLLGRLHYRIGNHAEAEGKLRQAHSIFVIAKRYSDAFATTSNLALIYNAMNRLADAIRCLEEALAGLEKEYHPNHPALLRPLVNLAVMYRRASRLSEADAALRRAEQFISASGSHHTRLGDVLTFHAEVLRKLGRKDEARQVARRAEAFRQERNFDESAKHTVNYLDLFTAR
ncbi:MAG TPA: tetratricopeptide repeat protein [Bryobacteraceae bacterium]|nr:tetratricopeptide repeat protein [Bryobacteraceae bacterium]